MRGSSSGCAPRLTYSSAADRHKTQKYNVPTNAVGVQYHSSDFTSNWTKTGLFAV